MVAIALFIFLEKVEKGEEYTPLTVSNSIKFINKAWRQVSSTTIVNCWRKAIVNCWRKADIIEKTNNNVLNELVINIQLEREKSNLKIDYIRLLNKYAHDYVEPFEHIDEEFELYLECDNKEKVSEDLTDENIASFCLKKNEETEEIEECIEELNINSETTFSEAKAAFELFTNFARLKLDDDKLLNHIDGIEDCLKLKSTLKQKSINANFNK